MASKAILNMYGKQFTLDSVSYGFRRNVEASGRVVGLVHGGDIDLSISTDSADTANILSDMLKAANEKGTNGQIVFYEAADSTKVMETVKLTGCFVYNYKNSYALGSLMQISFSLSCHKIEIGNNVFANVWPGDAAMNN